MTLLLEIYDDARCQDLPPGIEDAHEEFWGLGPGWLVGVLRWNAGVLGEEEEEEGRRGW